MYCKICGAASTQGSNYCGHDGASLIEIIPKLHVKKNHATFCPSCGKKTSDQHNYCGSCGASSLAYDATTESVRDTTNISDSKTFEQSFVRPRFQVSYLKQALIPALIAFAIMLVLNIFAYQYTNSVFNSLFSDKLSTGGFPLEYALHSLEEEFDSDIPEPDDFFGFSDMVMNSHLITPTYNLSADIQDSNENNTFEGSLHFSFTFVIYLLIPMLALFIGGMFAGRKRVNVSMVERLYSALCTGAIYGIILAFFSLFSGFGYDVNVAKDASRFKLDIDASYSFIKSLFIGLTVGTTVTFIGMLFSINYRQFTKHLTRTIPFGEVIHQAFSTLVRGLLVISVIMMLALMSSKDKISAVMDFLPLDDLSDKVGLFIITVGAQAGSILWNLAHLAPLHLDNLGSSDDLLTFSILGGLKGNGLEEFFGGMVDIPLYLYLVFLLPIALFAWSGYQMKKSNQASLKHIAIYSLIYAILIGFVSYLTQMNIKVDGTNQETPLQAFIGFSIFGTFIRAFIFSYIFAYVGGYIAKRKGY